MSSELEIWTNSPTTTLEKREALKKALGNYREHPEESTGVFLTVPSSKSPVFTKKKPVVRPLQKFPIIDTRNQKTSVASEKEKGFDFFNGLQCFYFFCPKIL